jgi:hypothetical protein
MKSKIAGMMLAAVLVMQFTGLAQTSGQTPWKSVISEKAWVKDAGIEWKENGFGIAPSADKNYGCIESKDRLPVSKNGEITIEITALNDSNVSLQVQTFDEKGNFIGAVDVLKEISATGKLTVSLGKFKLSPKAVKLNFKLWIGSSGKGSAQIKEISYKY